MPSTSTSTSTTMTTNTTTITKTSHAPTTNPTSSILLGDHIVAVLTSHLQLGQKPWHPPQGPIHCCSLHRKGGVRPGCPRGRSFAELLPGALGMGYSRVRFFQIHQLVYSLCEDMLRRNYAQAQPCMQSGAGAGRRRTYEEISTDDGSSASSSEVGSSSSSEVGSVWTTPRAYPATNEAFNKCTQFLVAEITTRFINTISPATITKLHAEEASYFQKLRLAQLQTHDGFFFEDANIPFSPWDSRPEIINADNWVDFDVYPPTTRQERQDVRAVVEGHEAVEMRPQPTPWEAEEIVGYYMNTLSGEGMEMRLEGIVGREERIRLRVASADRYQMVVSCRPDNWGRPGRTGGKWRPGVIVGNRVTPRGVLREGSRGAKRRRLSSKGAGDE
ncbi:hypothetical protein DFH27DRAFT_615879 [Peziza echinospora]|nr:hypothetical protein DFH27DRAFT_615879 [Peziza echinospora]